MKKYICAICGKEYESIPERAECESKCVAEAKKAEEVKKRNEYEAKRKESAQAIYEALDDVDEMIARHFDEYKTLLITKNYPHLKHLFSTLPWWI